MPDLGQLLATILSANKNGDSIFQSLRFLCVTKRSKELLGLDALFLERRLGRR